jgi:class 3 adenylate cyclase
VPALTPCRGGGQDWWVSSLLIKNLNSPDSVLRDPRMRADVVEIGDVTVYREVDQPGWRWSVDHRDLVGTEWCEARHVGVVVSGRVGVLLRDGTTGEIGPDDVFEIPPGHDAWTIGSEPAVVIEWTGFRAWSPPVHVFPGRVLTTLLFTDHVGSTATLVRLGDAAWREALSAHYEAARIELERFRGHEVETTGDGLLATFLGPAAALGCAAAIRSIAAREGLRIRAGVHVGEVEHVGNGVRGVAVHEAARIMAVARPDEILVSETTRVLAAAAGLDFEDRGLHELKGFPAAFRLFAYAGADARAPTED